MTPRDVRAMALVSLQTITLAGCGRDGCPKGVRGDKLCERCQLDIIRLAVVGITGKLYPRAAKEKGTP